MSATVRAGFCCLGAAVLIGLSVSGVALATPPPPATLPSVGPGTAPAPAASPGPVPTKFSGDVEAVAIRLEVDEPLPAGTGDLPNLSGEVNADEGLAKLTAAADLLGPTTGPKVIDPSGKGNYYADDPQASCGYPSGPLSASQSYPLDGTNQPTVQSQTTCGPGPSASGQAYATGGTSLLASFGNSSGHAILGPDSSLGALSVAADAETSQVVVPGIFSVAGVQATGSSHASGRAGGAASQAQVTVSGLSIAGASISLDRGGVSLSGAPPVPVDQAQPVIDRFNQAVAASSCTLTLMSNPSTFPQGPLFARPPLPNRVNPDGTDAGSSAAGFLVRCVIPDALNPTNFKPLILQALLGFVATETNASNPTDSGNANIDTGGVFGSVGNAVPQVVAPWTLETGAPMSGASQPGSVGVSPPGSASPLRPSASSSFEVVGNQLPVRGGLEWLGAVLAFLLGIFGVFLIGPWRVPLAAPGHPED